MPRSLHPLGHEHVIVQEGVEGILCSVEILERVDERVSEELKRQQLYDFLLRFLETYGAIYLIVESCSFFLPSIKLEGFGWYLFLLVLCAGIGLYCAWPKERVEFRIPTTDSSFEIKFGDILDEEGIIVIPVNEYFDSELGDHVSERSLHGKFIKKILGGHAGAFVDLTTKALAGIEPEKTSEKRSSGRPNRYAIGTVARVPINPDYSSRKHKMGKRSRHVESDQRVTGYPQKKVESRRE